MNSFENCLIVDNEVLIKVYIGKEQVEPPVVKYTCT
jgi:hypothetical protein